MDSIIIKPKKREELDFLKEMASKMGFSVSILTEEDQEDLGLLKAMEEGKAENEHVSRDQVMDTLKKIADG